tara:strand:+ start:1800 stop:2036 length:237 start_codon:yes stop_codon:yes gene_type:complete
LQVVVEIAQKKSVPRGKLFGPQPKQKHSFRGADGGGVDGAGSTADAIPKRFVRIGIFNTFSIFSSLFSGKEKTHNSHR